MTKARVTLLNLIMKENQVSNKSNLDKIETCQQICSLTDKDDMSHIVAAEMLKASKTICNAVKKWLYKKWRRCRRYVVDIYFDADHDIAEMIYLVGDFTNPKWTVLVPMEYSFLSRSFKAKVKMNDNSQFKFIIDGTYICCPHYPMTYSPEKHTNNVFRVNKIKLHSESRSFDYNGIRFGFNRRQEEGCRKRNTKIINQIAHQSFKCSEIYSGSLGYRLPYFSPDIRLDKKLHMKEKCNLICQTQNKISANNFVCMNGNSTFNTTSNSSNSDSLNSRKFDINKSNASMNIVKLSHIASNKNSKTPLMTNFNPLKFGAQKQSNNSHKDDMSDLSDEDLFFIDDYFKSNTVVTEDKIYLTNSQGIICSSPHKENTNEQLYFVANGYKISKNKNPSGDAFFVSKMGVGIADGVGGWQAYGIDSSSFSESLMSACKIICDKKEENLLKANSLSTEMLQNESYSEFLQNNDSMHTNEPSEISTSFGITVRNHKLRKIKSSFHLDDDFIQKCKESSGPNTEEFKSPQSDSTMKDKKKKINLNLEPRCIIKEAYRKVSASGSSTACVAVVQNKILKIANLGDSRCMLIRFSSFDNKSQILLKTDEQQHSFNAPYQLANIPEDLKHPKSKSDDKRVRFWNDNAEDSILYQCKVSEGDIVLLATDGLFDNLFIDEILQIIDNFMTELLESKSLCSMDSIKTSSNTPETYLADKNILNQKNAKKLAKNLVNEAFKKSRSHACNTPFGEKFNSSNLKRNNEILTWNGGKPDDICAVIGFIQN